MRSHVISASAYFLGAGRCCAHHDEIAYDRDVTGTIRPTRHVGEISGSERDLLRQVPKSSIDADNRVAPLREFPVGVTCRSIRPACKTCDIAVRITAYK